MAFFTAVDAPTKRRGLLRLALRVGGRPVLRACVKGAGGALLSQVDIDLNWYDQKNAYPCELARFWVFLGGMPDRVNTYLWSLRLYFSILVLPILNR